MEIFTTMNLWVPPGVLSVLLCCLILLMSRQSAETPGWPWASWVRMGKSSLGGKGPLTQLTHYCSLGEGGWTTWCESLGREVRP